MNRLLQSKHSRDRMPSSSVMTMWNAGDKLQTLGLTNPVISQRRCSQVNKCLEYESQSQIHCASVQGNITCNTVHTKHKSRSTSNLLANCLPLVHAQEKHSKDVEKNPDGKNAEELSSQNKDVLWKVSDEEVHAYIAQQTGMDRIRLLFGSFEELYGKREHPSWALYKSQVTFMIVLSFPFFAYGASQKASEGFKSRSVTVKFDTQFLAKRAHLDSMLFAGMRGGMRWSIKIGIAVALMLGISGLISTYRNKSGIADIVAGAGLGFGTVCLRTGPKAFLGGTVIGSVVGFFPAVLIVALKKWYNFTQEEVHFAFMTDLLQRKKMLEYQAMDDSDVMAPTGETENTASQPAVKTSDSVKMGNT